MKLGLGLPTAGDLADADAITQAAEGAERIGLDSIWTFERLLSPVGGVEMGGQKVSLPEAYKSVYAPLEVLAYAAAKTTRVTLGTSVIVALLHNPVDLARRFATLDQLSNGRVFVGLGQGWMDQEFEAAGVPKSRMGAGFADFVGALRAAWGPDPAGFDGEHYRFTESWVGPKPVQAGGPPVVVAASAPASVRRTARLGFGSNPIWFGWEATAAAVQGFRDAVTEAGGDPDERPVVVRVNGSVTEKPDGREPTLTGSPEQAAEALPRLERLGVTEVLWSMDVPVDDQLGLMSQLVG